MPALSDPTVEEHATVSDFTVLADYADASVAHNAVEEVDFSPAPGNGYAGAPAATRAEATAGD